MLVTSKLTHDYINIVSLISSPHPFSQGDRGGLTEEEMLKLTLHYYSNSIGCQLANKVIDRFKDI